MASISPFTPPWPKYRVTFGWARIACCGRKLLRRTLSGTSMSPGLSILMMTLWGRRRKASKKAFTWARGSCEGMRLTPRANSITPCPLSPPSIKLSMSCNHGYWNISWTVSYTLPNWVLFTSGISPGSSFKFIPKTLMKVLGYGLGYSQTSLCKINMPLISWNSSCKFGNCGRYCLRMCAVPRL